MDNEQISQLYRTYRWCVYGIVRAIVNDRETAMDITNTAFVRLKGAGDVHYPKSYVKRIARNLAIDYLRTRRPAETELFDLPVQYDLDLREWIRSGMELLSPRYRKVLRLRYWLDLNEPEAAAAMGLSRDAVNQLAHRARVALKEVLR